MELQLVKCHGMGNDFALVDVQGAAPTLGEAEMARLTTLLCARKGIVGADGAIFVMGDVNADAAVRIFNPSGGESELCINGIRCAGRYISEQRGKASVLLSTASGVVPVGVSKSPFPGVHNLAMHVRGIARRLTPNFYIWPHEELWDVSINPLDSDLRFYAITVGVPHILAIVNKITLPDLVALGEKANELTRLFPAGVNVSFVVMADESTLFIRTFGRGGAGLTLSCSSAMLAAAFLACELDTIRFGKLVHVYSGGGRASISCRAAQDAGTGEADIDGASTFVYTATLEYNALDGTIGSELGGQYNDAEVIQYGRYLESLGVADVESKVIIPSRLLKKADFVM
jgi:diaminopimelate epimerase